MSYLVAAAACFVFGGCVGAACASALDGRWDDLLLSLIGVWFCVLAVMR